MGLPELRTIKQVTKLTLVNCPSNVAMLVQMVEPFAFGIKKEVD